jgi:hypothetical protein
LYNSKIIATVEFDGFDGGGHKKPVQEILDPVSFGGESAARQHPIPVEAGTPIRRKPAP